MTGYVSLQTPIDFMYLRNVKGFSWNHKRVYRIYRELELNFRIKPKTRIRRDKPDALAVPINKNMTQLMFLMTSIENV